MPADRAPRIRWWTSLYWRVGLAFVAFVVALLLLQSAIFIYWVDRPSQGNPRHAQLRRVMTLAADIGHAIERGEGDPASRLRTATGAGPGDTLYLVLADGTSVGVNGGAVPDGVRRLAQRMLRGEAPDPARDEGPAGPAQFAPIQAHGVLVGFVVAAPRQISGVFREFTRVLSPQTFLILLALTALAAAIVVRPVRRRLADLEAAALRVAAGDLGTRAPDAGHDEVARVAGAFNRMSHELAARDAALQAADQMRRQLLADVSHELRTPLTTMRGYLETLQMDDGALAADRRRRYLGTVMDETLRLERIVADLVDLARVETPAAGLDIRVFAPARLFARVFRRHEQEAQRRRLTMTAEVAPSADQLAGDPDRLEQAIENLVGNALRYVPDGGTIALDARVEDGAAVLAVADTGGGIAPEHLMHVFDRFYKADPARVASGVGSGLGLSIVKAIVERHGGRIAVASEPGRTRFTITLPQAAAVDADAQPAAAPSANL
jgi:signal transduction histidine kinase